MHIDRFVGQVTDLREEMSRDVRADWFATHPFSPLRVRAAQLFAESELMVPGGVHPQALEEQVEDLMTLMDPGYLQERSEAAEAMRRLLFAGAVLVATVAGRPNKLSLKALEELLGAGSVPSSVNAALLEQDLAHRVARVNALVAPLRRAQVVRDLCLIVQADGRVEDAELRRVHDIADAIGVDRSLVTCTLRQPPLGHPTA